MSRIPRKFNYGSEVKNINETLYNQLNDSYYEVSTCVSTKTTRFEQKTNPPSSDKVNAGLDIGDIWINSATNSAWIMTSRTTAASVTWTLIT